MRCVFDIDGVSGQYACGARMLIICSGVDHVACCRIENIARMHPPLRCCVPRWFHQPNYIIIVDTRAGVREKGTIARPPWFLGFDNSNTPLGVNILLKVKLLQFNLIMCASCTIFILTTLINIKLLSTYSSSIWILSLNDVTWHVAPCNVKKFR